MSLNNFKIEIELTELDKLLLTNFELQVINDYNRGYIIDTLDNRSVNIYLNAYQYLIEFDAKSISIVPNIINVEKHIKPITYHLSDHLRLIIEEPFRKSYKEYKEYWKNNIPKYKYEHQ